MSIALAVKHMLAAGMSHDDIVNAVRDMEAEISSRPKMTLRQARNARYYEARKERLKASENVLKRLKASYETSPLFSPLLSSPEPPTNNPPIIPPSPKINSRAKTRFADGEEKSRGKRLPPGWHPGNDWLEFTRKQEITDERAQRALEEFRDYWQAVPGHRGVKLDWLGTWRNWVRKISASRQRHPLRSSPGRGGYEPQSTLAAYQRAAARFQRADGVPGERASGSDGNGNVVELPPGGD